MDVAIGATDVQFPRSFLISALALLFSCSGAALASVEQQDIHFSGDRQIWDRKKDTVELFGNAAVSQQGETLTADTIHLDLNERTLDAKSNCIYITADSVIWGEEMHFNLDTRTGTVTGGRISNDQFTLKGELIHKLGPGRFKTKWGEYTTCKDCSASWSIQGEDVDMQVDGYAYMSNVITRIKDAPTFWLPYLVVPIKTRRQTGLLFPSFSTSGVHGATFVLPFFWAIDRSVDMTLGLGEYTKRGHRVELEGRYALTPRSGGKLRAFYLFDRTFPVNRWAIDLESAQELPWGIEGKLRLTELSDNLYPFQFGGDVPRAGAEAYLPSSLSFSRSSSELSALITFQRNRNLLNSMPGDPQARLTQFDPRTVQALPSLTVTTNDKFLAGTWLNGGLTFGLTHFTRSADAFDFDSSTVPSGTAPPSGLQPTAGVDPIRKATRFTLVPTAYTTFRLFDAVSVVPSVQYRQFIYNFENRIPSLERGYLLVQTDLSAQLERIYEFPDTPSMPRAKHLIRPILTYSFIPLINEDSTHPFIQQIKQTGRPSFTPGYNFDDADVVPYTFQRTTANYFIPLGHSLTYGLRTQWIRRKGGLDSESTPSYETSAELSAGQAVNFLEISQPVDKNDPHIFSRFFSNLSFGYDRWTSQTTYYYYPEISPVVNRHTVSTNLTYTLERSTHQRILAFDRSFSFGYSFSKINSTTSNLNTRVNFSISDYLLPWATFSYAFEPQGLVLESSVGLQIQSPSQCWKVTTVASYTSGLEGYRVGFELALNLAGSGFGGVNELAAQASAAR